VDGDRRAGFDAAAIHAWIGLGQIPADDPEACRHEAGHQCRSHEGPEVHQCGCGGRGMSSPPKTPLRGVLPPGGEETLGTALRVSSKE
jgi:hypothetical protein